MQLVSQPNMMQQQPNAYVQNRLVTQNLISFPKNPFRNIKFNRGNNKKKPQNVLKTKPIPEQPKQEEIMIIDMTPMMFPTSSFGF